MNVRFLPPSENLIEAVAAHLVAHGRDYRSNLVVFPGRRPAHFLRKSLARKTGGSLIPPVIRSMDEFVRFVDREQLGNRAREIQWLDAAAILHRIHRESTARIGGDEFRDLDAFLPLGMRMFGEFEEVTLARVPRRKLNEVLGAVEAGGIQSLHTMYARFYQEIEQTGRCTRSLMYCHVAEHMSEVDLGAWEQVVLVGLHALTRAEKDILKQLLAMPAATAFFQMGRGLDASLRGLGVRVTTEEVPASPEIRFVRSPDGHGQVFALAGLIASCMHDAAADETTAIVLPASESLFPVVQHVLAMMPPEAYNISLGYPVERTPVFGFLDRLIELVSTMREGRFPVRSYLEFVLHPYTKNISLDHRSDVTRVVFHALEEHLSETPARSWISLEELEQGGDFFRTAAERSAGLGFPCDAERLRSHLVEIHDRTIRAILGARNVAELARQCIGILLYVDERSTARFHPLFRPFVECVITALEELSLSLLAQESLSGRSGYLRFLRHVLGRVHVPFPGTPVRGMQVLGFLETRCLSFDRVFVLDMTDDVLPGSGDPVTLIPQSLREMLGVPTTRDRERLAGLYFDHLLQGAREVHLLFPENERKERSRFVERLLWERELAEGRTGGPEDIATTAYGLSLSSPMPSPVPKSPATMAFLRTFRFTASALDTYLRCPLQFYYRHVTRLKERPQAAEDIDASDIGRIVHRILAEFFAPCVGRDMTVQDLEPPRLSDAVAKIFEGEFGGERHARVVLLQDQIVSHLQDFLEQHQKVVLAGSAVKILGLEMRMTASLEGHMFTGVVDRLEQRGDSLYVLDYKTGGKERALRTRFDILDPLRRESWPEAVASVQLPLYALLSAARQRVAPESVVPAYLLLGRNAMGNGIEMTMTGEGPGAGEKLALLRQVLVDLASEVKDPAIPFMPTGNVQNHCPRCPYSVICGTQWVERRTYD